MSLNFGVESSFEKKIKEIEKITKKRKEKETWDLQADSKKQHHSPVMNPEKKHLRAAMRYIIP